MAETEMTVKINLQPVDEALEKTNRLVELLREAQQIVGSLAGTEKSESLRNEELEFIRERKAKLLEWKCP